MIMTPSTTIDTVIQHNIHEKWTSWVLFWLWVKVYRIHVVIMLRMRVPYYVCFQEKKGLLIMYYYYMLWPWHAILGIMPVGIVYIQSRQSFIFSPYFAQSTSRTPAALCEYSLLACRSPVQPLRNNEYINSIKCT